MAAAALAVFSVTSAWSQAPDPSDVAEGGRLFRQKANCQSCHGWAGDGRKMDTQMPDGANLRESALDRQNLMMTIKCGRPGTGMPAFDKFAYSDGRCYGLKQSDLRSSGSRMPDPAATLQQREIDAILDFLMVKIVKQGAMDRAKCVEYWGSEVEACQEFRN
jgi:mono/diheme cytochrome c family protein